MADALTHLAGEGGTACGREGFITNLDAYKRPTARNWIESRTSNQRWLLAFGARPTCRKCLKVLRARQEAQHR